jgi:hypothetical protein
LNSDLGICTSFQLGNELEVWGHVFVQSKGLVLAGSDGQILIKTFDGWTPNPSIKAVGPLTDEIGALSTRDGLILAGSASGEIGGWSFDGMKLYQLQLREVTGNPYVRSISIRQNKFLVGRDDAIYEYEIPLWPPESRPITPHMIRRVPRDDIDWATYDIEGSDIRWRVVLDRPKTPLPLNTYRPVLPRSSSQYRTHLLSLRHLSNEIVIHDFKESKYIRGHRVDEDFFNNIQFMWCSYKQLFLINYEDTIYMMDFGKDLDGSQLDSSFEIAECFSLDMSSQR